MSNILEYALTALPIAITGVIVAFILYRRQSQIEFKELSRNIVYLDDELRDVDDGKGSNIEKLVVRGDVELRVLVEITEASRRGSYYFGRGKSARELKLERIQNGLRDVLRNTIDTENFAEITDRTIKLLDEVSSELQEIRQKIPFEGLEDPERSLLIDLIEEIDASKEIPRQKAQQLADIIKLKHQDIKKLQLENSKSAGWTRWGTVGTISFGLLSLVLSIYAIYT